MSAGASSRPELVLTSPECTWPGQRRPLEVCAAPETELRTGWWAERRCACEERAPAVCPMGPGGATPHDLLVQQQRQKPGGRAPRNQTIEVLNCGSLQLCEGGSPRSLVVAASS